MEISIACVQLSGGQLCMLHCYNCANADLSHLGDGRARPEMAYVVDGRDGTVQRSGESEVMCAQP